MPGWQAGNQELSQGFYRHGLTWPRIVVCVIGMARRGGLSSSAPRSRGTSWRCTHTQTSSSTARWMVAPTRSACSRTLHESPLRSSSLCILSRLTVTSGYLLPGSHQRDYRSIRVLIKHNFVIFIFQKFDILHMACTDHHFHRLILSKSLRWAPCHNVQLPCWKALKASRFVGCKFFNINIIIIRITLMSLQLSL